MIPTGQASLEMFGQSLNALIHIIELPVSAWPGLVASTYWYGMCSALSYPFGLENLFLLPIAIPLAVFLYNIAIAMASVYGGIGVILLGVTALGASAGEGFYIGCVMTSLAMLFVLLALVSVFTVRWCAWLRKVAEKIDAKHLNGKPIFVGAVNDTVGIFTASAVAIAVAGLLARRKKA